MKRMFFLFSLFAFIALVTGCNSDVTGELVQNGNTSLRLFEESTGSLLDLKNGQVKVELVHSLLLPTSDNITLRIKSETNSYLIRIQKDKIASDGTFDLNETDLEQPIRIKGKLKTSLAECSLANLINAEKVSVEIEIFKGFSKNEMAIGSFKTELKFDTGQKQVQL